MGKYLRDISLGKAEGALAEVWALSTNFLELLYLDSLPKLETRGVTKVIVEPCNTDEKAGLRVIVNPDVIKLSKIFDMNAYADAGKTERKRMALDFLQKGLLEIAEAKEWDSKPIIVAYSTVLKKGLVSERAWTKATTSPDRKTKAQIWCRYDSDKTDVYVRLSRRNGTAAELPIATTKPGNVWIYDVVGAITWLSNQNIKIVSQNGKRVRELALANAEFH